MQDVFEKNVSCKYIKVREEMCLYACNLAKHSFIFIFLAQDIIPVKCHYVYCQH